MGGPSGSQLCWGSNTWVRTSFPKKVNGWAAAVLAVSTAQLLLTLIVLALFVRSRRRAGATGNSATLRTPFASSGSLQVQESA